MNGANWSAEIARTIDGGYGHESYFRKLSAVLSVAQHFELPDGGRIFNDGLRGLPEPPWRLPYPKITAQWSIPLHRQCCLVVATELDGGGIGVFYFGKGGVLGEEWAPAKYMMLINENGAVRFRAIPVEGWKSIEADINDPAIKVQCIRAVGPILELVEALACKNVSSDVINPAASASTNAKRIRNGKLPIYELRRLVVVASKLETRADGAAGKKHAPPRWHLRRGHIRRLPSGNYWVNACAVGSKGRGVIEKVYEVTA